MKNKLPTSADDDIASGVYEDITWVIDASGKLTVEGSGEYFDPSRDYRYVPWYSHRKDIKSAEINITNIRSLAYMFYRCENLTSVNLTGLDTSCTESMYEMFRDCSSLPNIDLSGLDTSNITSISAMFEGCSSLTEVDLSVFKDCNLLGMNWLFGGCSNLIKLDMSCLNTENITHMDGMFYGCSNLKNLNLSGFDTSNVTNMYSMFANCEQLTELDLSGFDAGKVLTGETKAEMYYAETMLNGCSNLVRIKTPCNLTVSVDLPTKEGEIWCTPDGTEITELPQNLSYSIEITKKGQKLSAPIFTPVGGNIDKGAKVTLSTTQKAAIYYTTDGSAPSTSVTGTTKKYTLPVVVNNDMTIKAIAVDPSGEYRASDIAEAAYTVCTNNLILSDTSLTLKDGEEKVIEITELPTTQIAEDVSWSSSEPEVAEVDGNGKVTAKKAGKAVITAETTDSQGRTVKAVCAVTVQGDGGTFTLKPGGTVQLQIPSGISTANAKYVSSDTSVATVSSKGLVTAAAIGKAIVTFRSGGIEITYMVVVSNPLQSIIFEEEAITIETGETETNRIIFRPAYTETDRLLTVSTADESVAVAVVSGKTVRITGVAEGETTVTARSGQLEASCTVTVHKAAEAPDIKENIVYALTNRDRTLADLKGQLPSGFEFQNPETVLPQFAGVSEKEFAVIYTDENGRKVRSVQNVRFLTIKGIEPTVDNDAIEISDTSAARLSVRYLWEGYDAPGDVKEGMLKDYNLEVTPSKSGIVTVAEEEDFFAITGTAKGKVKLAVVLRKKGVSGKTGIVCQGAVNITVVEKKADIRIDVDGAEYDAEKDYYYVKDIKNAVVSLKALAEGYKVTWTSSDTGVATVGKAVDGVSRVTIKTNGKVTLTATANDTGKTSGSIRLYIVDATPSIDKAVTVNKAMEEGGTLGIYGSYGYGIEQFGV